MYSTVVTLGRNSNIRHKRRFLGSAGMNTKLGFKSKVRGVAMNPVDHPHGGRTKSNNPEKSP
jgi:large subunit ribosomal protein L2